MVAASDRDGVMFALSAGNSGDAPEGRALLRQLGPVNRPIYLLMDRAYEGDDTRALAAELGRIPSIFPRYDKIGVGFLSFVYFALIVDAFM